MIAKDLGHLVVQFGRYLLGNAHLRDTCRCPAETEKRLPGLHVAVCIDKYGLTRVEVSEEHFSAHSPDRIEAPDRKVGSNLGGRPFCQLITEPPLGNPILAELHRIPGGKIDKYRPLLYQLGNGELEDSIR